jgi:hypothetical protein
MLQQELLLECCSAQPFTGCSPHGVSLFLMQLLCPRMLLCCCVQAAAAAAAAA